MIVSTGTKALQDQLFFRDLPRVRSVLGARLKTALLKGRANYLCLHRLDQTVREGMLASREESTQLAAIRAWSARTRAGDRMELAEVPEESLLWPRVTSTPENCLGSECSFFDSCHVVRARREAQEADVVVVNHHLLFADLSLRQEGFGEILPGAQAFILDEAHQVPELAGQFFSQSISARQLTDLAGDVLTECNGVTGAMGLLLEPVEALQGVVKRLRLAMDALPTRGAFATLDRDETIGAALDELREVLAALEDLLGGQAERSRGLANAFERTQAMLVKLDRIVEGGGDADVRWYELYPRGFAFHATPLDLAPPLRAMREATQAAWIFTSATLSVAGDFQHFARQLGIDDPHSISLESPFDYSNAGALLLAGQRARSRPRVTIPTASSTRCCRYWKRPTAGPSCCSPRTARCVARRNCSPAACRGHCSCRAPRRAIACWKTSATAGMACCWARRVSGRAWTYRAMR